MRFPKHQPALGAIRSALVFAALSVVLLNCQPAAAQNFKQLPFGVINGRTVQTWSPIGLSDDGKAVLEMLNGSQPINNAVFDRFFNDIMFPLFAQSEEIKVGGKPALPLVDGPGGIMSPARMRFAFKSNYATKATNAAVKQHLNEITLAKMDQIASDNFHPVCRANAMMMIADLNQTEPGTPYANALPVLLKGVTAPTSIDAVRVAALRGILRHAQSGIANSAQPGVTSAMLALQANRTPPADRTQEGHDWICRRAIDVLEAMHSPGQNGAVLTALMKTVDDPAATIAVRATAARAVGNIPFTPPTNFNAGPWIKSLGKLAVDCYKAELAAAAADHKPINADRLKTQSTEIRTGLVGVDGTKGMILLSGGMKSNADLARFDAKQIDNVIGACATPVPAPGPTQVVAINGQTDQFLALPPDPQKALFEAIQKAGQELENALQRGPGAPADAGAPVSVPAGSNPF